MSNSNTPGLRATPHLDLVRDQIRTSTIEELEESIATVTGTTVGVGIAEHLYEIIALCADGRRKEVRELLGEMICKLTPAINPDEVDSYVCVFSPPGGGINPNQKVFRRSSNKGEIYIAPTQVSSPDQCESGPMILVKESGEVSLNADGELLQITVTVIHQKTQERAPLRISATTARFLREHYGIAFKGDQQTMDLYRNIGALSI